jgi:hypothetical protein
VKDHARQPHTFADWLQWAIVSCAASQLPELQLHYVGRRLRPVLSAGGSAPSGLKVSHVQLSALEEEHIVQVLEDDLK